jgi:hypothetical protein
VEPPIADTRSGNLIVAADGLGRYLEILGKPQTPSLMRSRRGASVQFATRHYDDEGGVRRIYRARLEHIASRWSKSSISA